MEEPPRNKGYSIIEIIIGIIVFAVGALALAASSAFVARAMVRNELRERRARIAANSIEIVKSQCSVAPILCANGAE